MAAAPGGRLFAVWPLVTRRSSRGGPMMAMLALADDRGDCGRRQLLPTCRGRMGGTEVVHMVADARAWWRRTVHDARTVHGRCACA